MFRNPFYRNVRARDHLEIFLVSAVSSLLLLRFFLYLTGYPQVGGGSLHIAHILWGGLFMAAAIVLNVSFLGARVQRFCALLGGVGFGIFIDELGKFITRDNNYFFRPTIGIIYAVFIAMYLVFNFLGRSVTLSPREYELNALMQFEEAVLQDMDAAEKARIRMLLKRAEQGSPITKALQTLLAEVETVRTPQPSLARRFLGWLSRGYQRFWRLRASNNLVGLLFVAQAAVFLLAILGTFVANFHSVTQLLSGSKDYGSQLILGQLVASVIAGAFAIRGAFLLPGSRVNAFENFRRAVLVNVFLTEFFIFSRIQFGAMPGFLANLALLLALRYALQQERRVPLRT
ncbi:MAG TPA: hypothetical protein VFI84_04530 [Candidatus Saccharimonadales bacterium]|nr:hypothetical protein [Candidatus Saccharimonadales bacterium]